MVHWRSFGRDFKTHLLEVLSSRYRPTIFSNKSGLWTAFSFSLAETATSSCMLRTHKLNSFQASFRSSGSLMLLAAILNALQRLPPCCSPAQSYLLTFKTWIQMPLPLNIPGKWVPTVGCAKTQESICLKSSIGQLLMWTSGLLSQRKRWLTTASQAVCNILRGETAFRQVEDNVESFSSSGSFLLILAIRDFLQRLPGCC